MLLAPLFKYLSGGLLFVSLLLGAALAMERRHSAKLRAQLERVTEARKADRVIYETAQRLAAQRNRAHVAKVEAEQERITADVTQSLSARLERLRGELRKAPPAAPGAAGGADSPANGETAGGVDGAAGVCRSTAEFLRIAENEERHDQLISWIERQLGVAR